MTINITKLIYELKAAGINVSGCNDKGIVWDAGNKEIQGLAAVKAVLAAHDPTDTDLAKVIDAKADIKLLEDWATMSAAEAETMLTDYVKDLATAKVALIKMAKLLILLRDYVLPRL